MTIKRIVANVSTESVAPVREFYSELFGLDAIMDLGWVATLAAAGEAPVQMSIASQGGSGTPVPLLSIEVDDVDEAYRRAKALGHEIAYGPTDEPWGVRRFYVRDPAGNLINVLSHP